MQKRFLIFSATFLLIILSAFSIKSLYTAKDKDPIVFKKGETYEKEWKSVEDFEEKGLPQSALDIVIEIYNAAKKENNISQLVKSLLFQVKIVNYMEEDGLKKAISRIENEAQNSKTPLKQILHSVNAELYSKYLEKNRWKIFKNTNLENNSSNDIYTWDAKAFTAKILSEYQSSLQGTDSLQRISIQTIEAIIDSEDHTYHKLWPTLYDFIAYRAIDGFFNDFLSLTKAKDAFKLDDETFFFPLEKFVNLKLEVPVAKSFKHQAFLNLQELLRFHLELENPDALIDADLYRLKWIHFRSNHIDKDQLYLKALKHILKQYKNVPHANYIRFQIAELSQINALNLIRNFEKDSQFKKYNDLALEQIDDLKKNKADSVLLIKAEHLLNIIQKSQLDIVNESVVIPDENFPIRLEVLNIPKILLTVHKIDFDKFEQISKKRVSGPELYKKLTKASVEISTKEMALPKLNDYQHHATDIVMDALPRGFYIISVTGLSDNGEKLAESYSSIQMSSLSYFQKANDNVLEVTVLDRKTGVALSDVNVQLWKTNYSYRDGGNSKTKLGLFKTDSEGLVNTIVPGDLSIEVEIYTHNDRYISHAKNYLRNKRKETDRFKTYFFLDRAIYRPGQTVHFKAITLTENSNKKWIQKGKDVEVEFMDVNYQKVNSLQLKSNEYGSVSGRFIIPNGILTGKMRLKTKFGNITFSVEEYKRPKFEVNIEEFSGNYKLNEKIEVKGKAIGFSGENINDAKFNYRVVRTANYAPYPFYRNYRPIFDLETEIISGEGLTNDKGQFVFEFTDKVDQNKSETDISFRYQVEVDVLDITGESHSDTKVINVGTTALKLRMDISEYVLSHSVDSFKISSQNLNHQDIDTKLKIELYEIDNLQSLKNDRAWDEPDAWMYSKEEWQKLLPNYKFSHQPSEEKVMALIQTWNLNTSSQKYWKVDRILKEGCYKMIMTAKDPFGKQLVKEQFFTVLEEKSKKMPKMDKTLALVKVKTVEPGSKAEVLIGSSFKNIKVLVEIDKKGQALEKRWIKLNQSKQTISIPVAESDRGDFYVNLSFIKENRVYQKSVKINVPHTDKKLEVSFETFRDKLFPGKKEEWRIKIKGSKGEKVAAEFLTGMYDASLDQFANNSWNFNILDYYSSSRNNTAPGFSNAYGRSVFNNFKTTSDLQLSKPSLNWFGFNSYGVFYSLRGRSINKDKGRVSYKSARMLGGGEPIAAMSQDMEESAPITRQASPMIVEEDVEIIDELESLVNTPQRSKGRLVLKVRKNFNETAFFYPELRTNEEGDVVFSFTLPESLTQWNFKGLAHTKDLKFGFIDEQFVSQKNLMVIPNAPRFFREGDRMEFPVKVSNLSKAHQKVNATIRFYNALTRKEITKEIYPSYKSHQLALEAGQSSSFKASIIIPESYQTISYKVIASTGVYADGEEKAIPVLSNRMLVTESLALPIKGQTEKTFKFDKLINHQSKTLTNYSYTLEMTSNPAWYAVQALPYLADRPNECAEQMFSRFYANALASHIAHASPKIKQVFETWRDAPNSKALLSNLDKNLELKSALLEETPWVMDAQNETEQKRRLGLLFDLNQLSYSQKTAFRKLKDLQTASGAWSWFKGMQENRYITQLIVSGMGHLRKLSVLNLSKDHPTKNMIAKAVSYLDQQIAKDYADLQKDYSKKELASEFHTNSSQIQYLYMRSFFNDIIVLPKQTLEAYDYYMQNSRQYWIQQSQYMQAMIALTSIRDQNVSNHQKVESKIVASLKEYALHSEEMGMYWKGKSGYNWNEAPIEKQALMIELFSEIGQEEKTVEELKVWLLKQKQTQSWKTTRATADAIYALLMNGTDLLTNDELVEITLGGKIIEVTEDNPVEAGPGYFKSVWKGEEIKPEMGEIHLKKNNDGVAWGAVYWQYFEDLDKITTHKTPLHIEKELYVEINSATGKQLKAVDNSDVKVGDKIVIRIVLRVDRAMDYVHLKDMRASGFEPLNIKSGYRWTNGLGYYESTKDASTNFYFDRVRKGTYVFEYPVRAVHEGEFSNGISNIQSMYAPEFTSHSEGVIVNIFK